MKALKIFGGLVAMIMLAALVFWIGWLRPASAQDVCDNIAEVTRKETGTELPGDAIGQCVARFSNKPKFGMLPWAEQTKCIADADTLEEIDACAKRS